MLPTDILKWADKYEIDHTLMWEIVETVTNAGDDLNYIESDQHLFDLTVEWLCAMIESVAEEDDVIRNFQTFILYYLPIVFALAPHLDTDLRSRIIRACHDDKMMIRATHLMLDRGSDSPTPPNQLR